MVSTEFCPRPLRYWSVWDDSFASFQASLWTCPPIFHSRARERFAALLTLDVTRLQFSYHFRSSSALSIFDASLSGRTSDHTVAIPHARTSSEGCSHSNGCKRYKHAWEKERRWERERRQDWCLGCSIWRRKINCNRMMKTHKYSCGGGVKQLISVKSEIRTERCHVRKMHHGTDHANYIIYLIFSNIIYVNHKAYIVWSSSVCYYHHRSCLL